MNRSNTNNHGCLEGNIILGERNGIYSWRIPLTITLIDHSIICPKKTFTLTIDTTYIYILCIYIYIYYVYIYIYIYIYLHISLCTWCWYHSHFFVVDKLPISWLQYIDIKRDVAIHIPYISFMLVGGWPTPLKNMSQLGWLSHILWKIKHVSNHQPVWFSSKIQVFCVFNPHQQMMF